MKPTYIVFFVITVSLCFFPALINAGGYPDCKPKMEQYRLEHGNPEEIQTRQGTTQTITYWDYPSQGKRVTFDDSGRHSDCVMNEQEIPRRYKECTIARQDIEKEFGLPEKDQAEVVDGSTVEMTYWSFPDAGQRVTIIRTKKENVCTVQKDPIPRRIKNDQCAAAMSQVTTEKGKPDAVHTGEKDGFHSATWTYLSSDEDVVFQWNDERYGACRQSSGMSSTFIPFGRITVKKDDFDGSAIIQNVVSAKYLPSVAPWSQIGLFITGGGKRKPLAMLTFYIVKTDSSVSLPKAAQVKIGGNIYDMDFFNVDTESVPGTHAAIAYCGFIINDHMERFINAKSAAFRVRFTDYTTVDWTTDVTVLNEWKETLRRAKKMFPDLARTKNSDIKKSVKQRKKV